MVQIDDNTMILKYIFKGSQKTQTIHYSSDIHELKGYYSDKNVPLVVTEITLGKNLTCYGLIVTNINNQNLMNYQHFSEGSYEFKTPLVFLTIHLSIKGTKVPL